MAEDGFGRLKTVVVVAAEKLRDGIVSALKNEGFRDIDVAASAEAFTEHLRNNEVDLVVTLFQADQMALGRAVRDLRLGLLDCSPFPVVLALLPNADKEQVMATLDAGVDDLLIFPLSSETLFKRIRQFAQDRRPFVVTHDYIGPDRRLNPRAEQAGITLIKVPNPVRSRVAGVQDRDIRRSIEDAVRVIDREKLRQNALHLLRLIDRFQGNAESSPTESPSTAGFLAACLTTCEDVARRARGSAERDIRERAERAIVSVRGFAASGETPDHPEFPEVIRRIEAIVYEISAYHGAELTI